MEHLENHRFFISKGKRADEWVYSFCDKNEHVYELLVRHNFSDWRVSWDTSRRNISSIIDLPKWFLALYRETIRETIEQLRVKLLINKDWHTKKRMMTKYVQICGYADGVDGAHFNRDDYQPSMLFILSEQEKYKSWLDEASELVGAGYTIDNKTLKVDYKE